MFHILCVCLADLWLQSQFSVGMIEGVCRLDLRDLWQGLINAEISSRIGELLPWKHGDKEREASGQRVPRGRGD